MKMQVKFELDSGAILSVIERQDDPVAPVEILVLNNGGTPEDWPLELQDPYVDSVAVSPRESASIIRHVCRRDPLVRFGLGRLMSV